MQGLFNNAVWLAGNDEPIFRNTDIQTLTASAKCKHHGVWFVSAGNGNCHTAFKLGNGFSKGIHERHSRCVLARDNSWDDFCIGGNWLCNMQPIANFDVGMVVNVAV